MVGRVGGCKGVKGSEGVEVGVGRQKPKGGGRGEYSPKKNNKHGTISTKMKFYPWASETRNCIVQPSCSNEPSRKDGPFLIADKCSGL